MNGLDRAVWDDPVLRRALAARDVSIVYRMLIAAGARQCEIAEATRQSQSEISAVLAGRRVHSYDLLVRIADGLQIPRGWMGLAYAEGVAVAIGEEVDEDMKRRALLAAASVALFNRPVLGELLELPTRPESPTPLPARLGMADVDALRDLTQRFRVLARHYGGQGEAVSAVAVRSLTLMTVPSSEQVRASLASALAELHTVAGWCCFDSGAAPDAIRAHFTRAMELAVSAGDTYRAVDAFYHAGMALQGDDPNQALKMFQVSQFRLGQERSDHPRTGTLDAWLHADSARSLIMMDRTEAARAALAAAREKWHPADRFDQADMDHVMAQAHRELGELDTAERLASSSARTWAENDRRDGVQAAITLASIHLEAGEPDGLTLAEKAIRDAATLRSQRARARVGTLAEVLETRPGETPRELAVHARRVATSPA